MMQYDGEIIERFHDPNIFFEIYKIWHFLVDTWINIELYRVYGERVINYSPVIYNCLMDKGEGDWFFEDRLLWVS